MGPGPLPPSLIRVLQGLSPPPDARALAIERLGAGAQADLFVVRLRDRQPLWQAHTELVVKLYKGTDPDIDAVARDEFESLSRLNARLDGRLINGWRIRTPTPLLHSGHPPGLVMTMVPGRPLNAQLRAIGDATAGELEPLAGAISAALGRYWEEESRIYGDIDFNNILCEPGDGVLSFVDPGMPERAYLCAGVDRLWYPASRDLAYLIFDVATSLRSWFGRPAARRSQEALAEQVVRAFLGRIDSAPGKAALLDEVHACARVHLRRIKATWSPAGIWRLLLRGIASRSIARTIDRLRDDAEASRDVPVPGVLFRHERGGPPCLIDRPH